MKLLNLWLKLLFIIIHRLIRWTFRKVSNYDGMEQSYFVGLYDNQGLVYHSPVQMQIIYHGPLKLEWKNSSEITYIHQGDSIILSAIRLYPFARRGDYLTNYRISFKLHAGDTIQVDPGDLSYMWDFTTLMEKW